jgi:menaquinone-9 beta-reductase
VEIAEYDLIVVGAGPAGSACAITAARAGARVLLLEKDRFPRHKVCGEFVSSESLHLLEWLIGKRRFESRPEIANARVFSGRQTIPLPISPSARSIPRFDLDAALLDAARQAGAHAQEGTTVSAVEQRGIFTVKTAARVLTARAVVNASGRWSQLTERPAGKEKWIGLKAHFREHRPSLTVDLYFFKGGYCGVQPVSEDAVNACAMVRAEHIRSLEEAVSRHPELSQRSRGWQRLFAPVTTSQLYFRRPQTESGGMLLAGDAAAFIDPFAGDGISLALHSGSLAAESLVPFFQGKCSLEKATQQYCSQYLASFGAAFRNAARIRRALSAPWPIRSMLVRLIAVKPFARAVVRGTRARSKRF